METKKILKAQVKELVRLVNLKQKRIEELEKRRVQPPRVIYVPYPTYSQPYIWQGPYWGGLYGGSVGIGGSAEGVRHSYTVDAITTAS
jgi:hypothetical protein